ncbi:hypothetical protein AB0O31_20660 [Kitasatospora cineracea]|uniref:hypothetical protein n=1 Tax=Kitasatospora cineracea TaxID=88074 RepID=UPI00342AB8F2
MGRTGPHHPEKTAPGPLRARARTGCAAVVAVLALLFVSLLGGTLAYGAAGNLGYQTGWRGTPRLAMTIDSCSSHGSGRNVVHACFGHGDRGSADTVDGEWLLDDLSHGYPRGTVLSVRCSPTGGCVEIGAGRVAADVAKLLFGLWLATLTPGAGLALLSVRRNERPGRTPRSGLSLPFRLGLVYFAALPALALLSGILSLFL